MGIDYILALPCQVKESLTEKGFVELIKKRNRARLIIEMSRQSGDEQSPSEITFVNRLQTTEGVVDKEICVQDLLDEVAQLVPLEHYCSQCPANMVRQPFGCYGYISYPIEAASEEWLMARLPADINSLTGQLLQKAVRDFGYTGESIKRLRRKGMTYFERGKPLTRRWGNMLSGWKLSSDQMFEMMFLVGNIKPIHAAMMAYFYGIIPQDLDSTRLMEIMRNTEMLSGIADPPEGESLEVQSQIDEFRLFLLSLKKSASLNLDINIDI